MLHREMQAPNNCPRDLTYWAMGDTRTMLAQIDRLEGTLAGRNTPLQTIKDWLQVLLELHPDRNAQKNVFVAA